ncbi:MAG: hypothetical protein ACRCX2_06155 [Paraclostridium sp.]
MEMPKNTAVETGVETTKVVKEKKIPETNILVGITPEHLAKFKEGRSLRIATLLSEGNSKSEVLKMLAVEEAETPVEGRKPITHQVIYQVYKRLKSFEGVEIGTKELVITRVKKEASEKVEEQVEEKVDVNKEFEDAADVSEDSEVVEG